MNRMESIKNANKHHEAKHPNTQRTTLENRTSTISLDLQAKALLSNGFCASDIARTLGVSIEFIQKIELDEYHSQQPRKRIRSATPSPENSLEKLPIHLIGGKNGANQN